MRRVHGWRRVARWVFGSVAGLLGFVALLLVAAFVVFQTDWGRDKLRAQIESRLDDAIVGGASIGGLEGNPLTELVLTDVVINGPDGEPAIRVERLTVELPLLPLISKQLRVDKVIAEGLDVRMKKLASGEYNVQRLTKPSEKKSTWSIKLPNVEVHRGHVQIDQGGGVEVIDLDDLEVYVDAALPFAGPIDAALTVQGRWRQKDAPVDLAADIHSGDEVLAIHNAAGRVGEVKLAVVGVRIPKGPFATPLAGTVAVHAPATAVRTLVPQIELPQDVALAINMRPDGRLTHFVVHGMIGTGEVRGSGSADVQAKLARGVVSAANLELDALTNGRLVGQGGAVAAFDVDLATQAELPTANAMITAWAATPDAPRIDATIALYSEGDTLRATIGAASDSGIRAGIGAVVRKNGESIVLERGHVIARTLDLRRATQGQAPVRGVLSANLSAEGTLAPEPDLAIEGYANGRRLRMSDFSAGRLALRIDARHIPSNPAGSARVELVDLERGDMELGKLTVAAGNRPDGKLQVSVRSQPKQAPWLVDLDALVTTGETIVVDLQRHFVRAAGGSVWRGTTGIVTISPRKIEVRDLKSRSRDGTLSAAGYFIRTGRDRGDLEARLDASVDLSNLAKVYTGKVDAHVDLRRANGRFAGVVDAKASGVCLSPYSIRFDGQAKIEAKADQLLADIGVATTKSGRARLAIDVDAPKDVTDVRAWRTLGRDAIRTAKLTLDDIVVADMAKLVGAEDQQAKGTIDGTVELSPAKAGGTIAVRGVQTRQTKDLGSIDADLTVQQADPGELRTSLVARLVPTPTAVAAKDVTQSGQARLFVDMRVVSPDRIFDPAAWQRLGARAFRGGTLRAERLAFQPGTLERLGIVSALRGELAIGAEIEEGMRAVRFAVNLHELRGGLFAKPVAIGVVGAIDDSSSRVRANVRAQGVTLVQLTGELPITLDQLRTDPESARTAKLAGTARIQQVPATTLMGVLGTSQITGGTLDGTIALGGTVATPTVDAKLVATNVTVPDEGTRQVQQIEKLSVAATWNGQRGNVVIDGDQTGGGVLRIRAAGAPDALDQVTASIYAKQVDIAPLVAFMPGPAGGLAGRLEADFKLRGADPRTANLSGKLRVTDGRIPIAPAVGTLFKGDVRVNVQNQVFRLDMTGKLGRGDVKVAASAPLEGVTPKSGKAEITVNRVQLIGQTEPILTGVVNADLARVGDTWRSNVRVQRMKVEVPEEQGTKLSPVGAPSDLVYGGEKIHHGKNKGKDVPRTIVHDHTGPEDFKEASQVEGPGARRRLPTDPVLVANINLRNVFVESQEVRGLVGGRLRVSIAENREVTVDGNVALTRGVLDLFNRRYQVDKAMLHFDGSTDPVLDVRITHDFPDVTTITEVRGRMSDPQLLMSSEPATYSQAELLGFLLGGEPGGAPEMAPSATERVAGAGASLIGNKIGGYVKRALPVDVDVLRYEAQTSTSSAAVTVGTWITDTLFLAYRRRLESRPDENAGEAEIEYWLRRRLVLEAVVGDRNVNGLDLLWRRRW